MHVITRRLEFDYAHRILGHENKCRFLHGHRGAAEVSIRADRLDTLGRIVDFMEIKDRLGKWLDAHWDHNVLLSSDDPLLRYLQEEESLSERAPYVLSGRPTAENMAYELCFQAKSLLPLDLTITRVRIYETPNCWADYTPEERR